MKQQKNNQPNKPPRQKPLHGGVNWSGKVGGWFNSQVIHKTVDDNTAVVTMPVHNRFGKCLKVVVKKHGRMVTLTDEGKTYQGISSAGIKISMLEWRSFMKLYGMGDAGQEILLHTTEKNFGKDICKVAEVMIRIEAIFAYRSGGTT